MSASEVAAGRTFLGLAKKGGEEAAKAAYERLLAKAKARAKTDLRLWAPALYQSGGRRQSEDVIHVSCLVLDYDSGVSIDEASNQWDGYYHIVHTTWSHRQELHKFRLCLPLRRPVRAQDWREFWTWAAERVGMRNDPALKSPSSTFALPATGDRTAPRRAFVRGGRLLDAVDEGVLTKVAEPPPPIVSSGPNHWRGDDPDYPVIELERDPKALAVEATSPTDDDFNLFGGGDTADEWEDEFDDLF